MGFLVRFCQIQAWSCLERFCMDCVWFIIIGEHDILIALAWCNWEPSCSVRIHFPWEIHCLEEDKIGVFLLRGVWELIVSGSGSEWITFFCVDLRPFCGYWRCSNMVFSKCLCTRSNDRPGQEVTKFFVVVFPIQIERSSSRMRGDSQPMWFLTCTRKRSLKNIRQEL